LTLVSGLGTQQTASIRVRFPDGSVVIRHNVVANQTIIIRDIGNASDTAPPTVTVQAPRQRRDRDG